MRGAMIAVLTAFAAASVFAQGSNMSRVEAAQLYAAGGFPISPDGRHPTDRCGKPANPKITFVDINGDGQKDALFTDAGPCYGADARWFGIATRDAGGPWRGIAGATGTVKTVGTTTGGWFDLQWTSGGRTVPLRYDGRRYVVPGEAPLSTPPHAARPAAPAPAASAPASGGYPTDGWTLPMPVSRLKPAELEALYRAAGFRKVGGAWKGCDGQSDAFIFDADSGVTAIQDLNGDGRPEVMVGDSGTFCYGNTGQGFTVLTAVPGGWKTVTSETGIPSILATKGVGGWRDIVAGGPGFCQPVLRWDGRQYAFFRSQEEEKGACRGR